jgi:myo-inositol-1(or 4)-monophosphatase
MELQQYQKVEELVNNASNLLLDYRLRIHDCTNKLEIESKIDGSLVSEADLAVNKLLLNGLKTIFPNDNILSEESGFSGVSNSDGLWIVDPLDGTNSFLEGRDDFSILLAHSISKSICFSLMSFPAKGILVRSVKDGSCFANGNKLGVSMVNAPRQGRIYLRNMKSKDLPSFTSPEKMDSGFALFNVANGFLDGAIIHLTHHREWDLAAPTLAILESGGSVTDENGGDFHFGFESIEGRYFVASNGSVHKQLLNYLRSMETL